MKKCIVCNREKELTEFYKRSGTTDKYRSRCRNCDSEYRKKSYSKNRDRELKNANAYAKEHKEEKEIYNKNYYVENRQDELIRTKTYRENNKEYYTTYSKNNRERYRIYRYNKRHSDTLYKLKGDLRSMSNFIFKNKGYKKNTKTEQLLGCSFFEFKMYLESKFETWMSWNNKGLYNSEFNYGWDIDHIIPLSSAKSEEDLIKLCHYTNLQPLCSYINRVVKKDKMEEI